MLGGGWGPCVSAGGPRTHFMVVTFEVSHCERSALKDCAPLNADLLCTEHRSTPNEQTTPARWSHVHYAHPTPHGARLAAWWWLWGPRGAAGGPRTHIMVVTFEVSHVEMSPLKAFEPVNASLLCI